MPPISTGQGSIKTKLGPNFSFSALTLLVGQQEGHPVSNKDGVVGCWRGYLSGVRCRLALNRCVCVPMLTVKIRADLSEETGADTGITTCTQTTTPYTRLPSLLARAALRPNGACCCSSGITYTKLTVGQSYVDPVPIHFPFIYPYPSPRLRPFLPFSSFPP